MHSNKAIGRERSMRYISNYYTHSVAVAEEVYNKIARMVDHELGIKELADSVALAFDGASPIVVAQPLSATRLISRYVPAIEHARVDLDLNVLISVHDALLRTAGWHQKHENYL